MAGPTGGKFGSALPGTDLGQRPLPTPIPSPALPAARGAALGPRAANSGRRGINRRRAVALRITGGTVHLSSHAPGWLSTAYEQERSGTSAMMATNRLAGERGVFTFRCSQPADASRAGAEPQPRSTGCLQAWSHLGLGLRLLPLPVGKAPPTARVVDNTGILEPLSCEATKEIYYL